MGRYGSFVSCDSINLSISVITGSLTNSAGLFSNDIARLLSVVNYSVEAPPLLELFEPSLVRIPL